MSTTANLNLWIGKGHRADPNAAEFADYLATHCVWAWDDFDYAGWDAPIPPREKWEEEVNALNEHLDRLDRETESTCAPLTTEILGRDVRQSPKVWAE